MSFVKKTWSNGNLVTPEDFNRIEQGIKDNETNKANKATTDSLSQQINVLTKTENMTITYLNGYTEKWGGSYQYRKGNTVQVYLNFVAPSNVAVTDIILKLKYKPIGALYPVVSIMGGATPIINVLSTGDVRPHTLCTSTIAGKSILASFSYVTNDAFTS